MHAGLLAARLVTGADVAVVAQGPGNLGTGTRWGFSGRDRGRGGQRRRACWAVGRSRRCASRARTRGTPPRPLAPQPDRAGPRRARAGRRGRARHSTAPSGSGLRAQAASSANRAGRHRLVEVRRTACATRWRRHRSGCRRWAGGWTTTSRRSSRPPPPAATRRPSRLPPRDHAIAVRIMLRPTYMIGPDCMITGGVSGRRRGRRRRSRSRRA